jgi:hypothetical protein
MARDRLQKQRFELNYLVSEEFAILTRDFLRAYLDYDEHCVGKADYSYLVESIYVDSDDLKLYRDIVDERKIRYQLRLRYYSIKSDAPVFFEIKKWISNCTFKQRAGVRPECVESVLTGSSPQVEHLVSKAPEHLVALQNFLRFAQQIRARPKIRIAYMREAYVSDDGECRVTLDRNVVGEPHVDGTIADAVMKNPRTSFSGQVIVELKFTRRFPEWFKDLIRLFGAAPSHALKYAACQQRIRES